MDIKQTFEKLKSAFTSDKKLAVLCAVGVLGVLLLIISEFRPSDGKKAEKKESVTAVQNQETYAEDIEKRLTEIVSSIDGAGKTRVMVTLDSGAEQVYAKNEKIKRHRDRKRKLFKRKGVCPHRDGRERGRDDYKAYPAQNTRCCGRLRGRRLGCRAAGDNSGDNRRARYQRVARIYHKNVGVTSPFK